MFLQTFNFNSQLNNWDTSNVRDMSYMFRHAKSFNQPIDSWDVSNVTFMESMFEMSKKFNQNISSWNLDKIEYFDFMFEEAKPFLDKYNNGEPLSSYTDEIKKWFNLNRDKMNMIDVKDKHGTEIDNFFSNFSKINNINR